jgi:two-component system cell cycle response regulator
MAARILVIEDNPTNLALMANLLKAFGHTVLTAIDGDQGLAAVRSEVPDLIVCDVQIPKLDGYEVAKQLKNHPTLCKIPLIAVTALAMVGDREKMLTAGFHGYIPKPIDPKTFVPEVEALRDSTHSRPHHPVPPLAAQPPTKPINPTTATILVVDNSTVNLSLGSVPNLLKHLSECAIVIPSETMVGSILGHLTKRKKLYTRVHPVGLKSIHR